MLRLGTSSDTIGLSLGFRKSTPPQNRSLKSSTSDGKLTICNGVDFLTLISKDMQ